LAEDIGSTVPRRQLGRLLRRFRTEANITLDAAAQELEYSRQKIWRMECGMAPVRVIDVKAICELYDVPPRMAEAMRGLAAETRSHGWWHAYGDAIPTWFELYVGLESAAAHLRGYDESLIPGILQTREYANALYQPKKALSEEDRERAVQVRLHRQAVLTRRLPKPPRYVAILNEAVLRRSVVGARVLAEQLKHLLTVTQLPNVSVRVLPLTAGPHPGAVAGTFMILNFPPSKTRAKTEPPVVYSESLTGALYLDKEEELASYEELWAGLTELSLDEAQSKEMINKIIGEIQHD
jgi:transcriptional regulator with XRE-family HTH domain